MTRTMTMTMRRCAGFMAALAMGVPQLADARAPTPAGEATPTVARETEGAKPGEQLVDVESLGRGYAELEPEIETRVREVLANHPIDPEQVHVHISWLDENALSYVVRVYIETDTGERSPTQGLCRSCTSDAVIEMAAEVTKTAVATATEPAPAEDAAAPDPAPAPVTTAPPPQTDRERRLHALGVVGVAGLSLGVAGLATGAAFLVIKEMRPRADKSLFRDLRPSGYALVAVGGALVVAGAVTLGLDLRATRRERRTAFFPVAGPGQVGFAVRGRF